MESMWQVNCKLKARLSRKYFELEAENHCKVGDKIVPFLRGSKDRFDGSSMLEKEQFSAEYDLVINGLQKAGLLPGVKSKTNQPKGGRKRGRGSNSNPPKVGGGGVTKGKGKSTPGQPVKGKKCHKCGKPGHLRASCPDA